MTTTAADETRLDGQATQTADVTEPSGESAELDELARWLDAPEETQDDAAQNPEPEETESDATTTEAEDDPELEAAIQAKAERLAEEKAEQVRTEERARQDQERDAAIAANRWRGVEESFRQRAPRIRSHLQQVLAGEAELNIDGVLNEFNAHHAQMQAVRDYEWHEAIYNNTAALLSDADKQRLADLKQRGQLPVEKLLEERDKAVAGKSKEGLHPESRLKEEHARGALAFRAKLDKLMKDDPSGESVLAVLRSRGQPAASRNTNPPARTRATSDILTDPSADISLVNDLLAKAGL